MDGSFAFFNPAIIHHSSFIIQVLAHSILKMSNFNLRNIHPEAQIGKNVTIEPFATIERDVIIGDNCRIGANAVIAEGTRMGEYCQIFPGAAVGTIPQDLKFKGETSWLTLGNGVKIREYCTLNRGTTDGGLHTKIGDNCLLMAYTHIAHDCIIGKNCVFANNSTLAGHIEVGDFVVMGGMTAVQQFVVIGDYVFIGGTSKVRKHIPPFIKADRDPLAYAGVNVVGLTRQGFTRQQITLIQDCYRLLFIRGLNTAPAIEEIRASIPDTPERAAILHFLGKTNLGIIRGPRLNGSKFRPIEEEVLEV